MNKGKTYMMEREEPGSEVGKGDTGGVGGRLAAGELGGDHVGLIGTQEESNFYLG